RRSLRRCAGSRARYAAAGTPRTISSAAHQGSQMSRMSPAATPPAAILAFFDMSVASFAATAALCRENGPALPAVPDRAPETSLRSDLRVSPDLSEAADDRSAKAHDASFMVTRLTAHAYPTAAAPVVPSTAPAPLVKFED